jgi:hypothetical protein
MGEGVQKSKEGTKIKTMNGNGEKTRAILKWF